MTIYHGLLFYQRVLIISKTNIIICEKLKKIIAIKIVFQKHCFVMF